MRRAALLALFSVLASFPVPVETATPTPARPSPGWAAPSPDVVRLVSEGVAAFQAGNLKSALKRFQEADNLAEGRSWDAATGMATVSIQLGRYAQARDIIQKLLEVDAPPGGAGLGQQLMGMCLAGEHRLAEAEAAFREALELRPNRPLSTRIGLAAVLCSLGREEEGLQLLDDEGLCAQEGVLDTGDETAKMPVRFEVGGSMTEPVKLSGSSPKYLESARLAYVEGKVILDLIIGDDGAVRCVRVIDGLPFGLSCSAAVAVANWKFKPSTERGEPIECRYILSVRFDLR